jgi:hypothetical protein
MCTLILGRDLPRPGEVLLAANRDEDPARASEPPHVLRERPRLVGGRDAVAGGTWLAVRGAPGVPIRKDGAGAPERSSGRGPAGGSGASTGPDSPAGPAAVLLLNRPPLPGQPPGRRSRGLLVLDVAAADDPVLTAREALASGAYGPCTLVYASPVACWLMAIPGGAPGPLPGTGPGPPPRMAEIGPGWHAITHAELDDAREPRTAWLTRQLRGRSPQNAEQAFAELEALLAHHGDGSSPAVCIHAGRMPTVSASLLLLGRERTLYRHADGRPCERPFVDASALLEEPAPPAGRARERG